MLKNLFLFYFITAYVIAFSQEKIERPKLVVGIVVDQMRQEYLYRFYEKFGKKGFKTLMNDGYMMRNAHYNYVPTYTGPGHASIYTGTTPKVHGIIGNDWYFRSLGKELNCVEDSTVVCVGGDVSFGKYSPIHLLSSTITDELRIFTQNKAKVISISLKNRGAILPGGHNPTGAYWFDETINGFVTSTWYMDKLPQWVNKFNAEKRVEKYMKGKWETLLSIEQYIESNADNNSYESIWKGRKEPTFPYNLEKLQKKNNFIDIFNHTPFGNDLVKNFVLNAVEAENLGQDDITDFLAISFSAGDRIGHWYGPHSVEIQDTYLRLDQNLKEILNFLDAKIGVGNYTVFLTSDHGVADVWEYMHNEKQQNYIVKRPDLKSIYQAMYEQYGEGNWIVYFSNNQIYLNNELITSSGKNKKEMIDYLCKVLKNIDGISSVYSASMVNYAINTRDEMSIINNGYHPNRSGDIMITFKPGWIYESSYYANYGSGHSTHYTYDTHVPMLFYGWGIKKGSSVKYHPITDLTPTISMLLNIKLPSGATGNPIEEILD